MQPFYRIVPDAEPIMTLVLDRKTRAIPKGRYGFIECYCTEPRCDCRRVTLVVMNEKMKEKAVIVFGFDQKGPFAGPYLDGSTPQSPYASELLDFFVASLNATPDWLNRLYRHYRTVREKVEGRSYRGKAFPKPGSRLYRVMPPPDLEAEIEQSLSSLAGSGTSSGARHRPSLSTPAREFGMAHFVRRYAEAGTGGPVADLIALQDDLRRYLFQSEQAVEELASLLPTLYQHSPEKNEQIDAALRLLFETLDVLRLGVESRRSDARLRMEMLQRALAQRIFIENEDLDLCAAVSNVLVQSRVEILPVLREATSKMMMSGGSRGDLHDLPGEEIMVGIFRSLESMGINSPFEAVHELLQLFTLNEPEMQTAIIGEMLRAETPLLREISALMLFHHEPEVRMGVSRLLATLDGRSITAETLRRLIVSRNWFPEEIRRNVDQAITCARKARVECAPLAKPPSMTVYASSIDGSGAQSFQVIVPEGKGYLSCSVLLKQGGGVTDAFLVSIKNKRDLSGFLGMLKREGSFLKSSVEHMDLRICQALADGAAGTRVPGYQLVRIAEVLGCDRWKSIPLDVGRELLALRQELLACDPRGLDDRTHRMNLEMSGEWRLNAVFLASWFEDDDRLDREVEASRGRRKSPVAASAVKRILDVVLEERRDVWLERLLLTTLWLRSAKEAWTFPWFRLFHVCEAVADRKVPLRKIPMMVEIARASFQAYKQRVGAGRG